MKRKKDRLKTFDQVMSQILSTGLLSDGYVRWIQQIYETYQQPIFTPFTHLVSPGCRHGGWCLQLAVKSSTLTCGTRATPRAFLWRTAILLVQVRQRPSLRCSVHVCVFVCIKKCYLRNHFFPPHEWAPCCVTLPFFSAFQPTCRPSKPPWSWPPFYAASASLSSSFSSLSSSRERDSFSPPSSSCWPVSARTHAQTHTHIGITTFVRTLHWFLFIFHSFAQPKPKSYPNLNHNKPNPDFNSYLASKLKPTP